MFIILEVLLSSIRVLLLFFGAIFTFILGENLYRIINNALFAYSIPCMELLSIIIAVISPIAYFFGIYHKLLFFKRQTVINIWIFLLSFVFGIVVTFLPITGFSIETPYCMEQVQLMSKILQSLLTGVLTAFIVFVSMDIGVFQATYLSPSIRKMKPSSSKKRKK